MTIYVTFDRNDLRKIVNSEKEKRSRITSSSRDPPLESIIYRRMAFENRGGEKGLSRLKEITSLKGRMKARRTLKRGLSFSVEQLFESVGER
ncbi:hypothetical protein WN51_05710 [Melipona quadrifasciata]|uniref:Uncharacterized protein n=1 Tax=Melipona quadrifasciata TaxID=166423 RepID=A0A0M9ADF5_9HYME|nr:hypothetical protein WN51_05710 [Melipona quadrifasciata]